MAKMLDLVQKMLRGEILPPPLIYIVTLDTSLILHAAYPFRLLPNGWSVPPGIGFIITGTLLAISGFRAMGRVGTKVNPYEPTTALVKTAHFGIRVIPCIFRSRCFTNDKAVITLRSGGYR